MSLPAAQNDNNPTASLALRSHSIKENVIYSLHVSGGQVAARALQLHFQNPNITPAFTPQTRCLARHHGFPIFQEQAEEQHGAGKVDKRVDAETGAGRKAKSKD